MPIMDAHKPSNKNDLLNNAKKPCDFFFLIFTEKNYNFTILKRFNCKNTNQ